MSVGCQRFWLINLDKLRMSRRGNRANDNNVTSKLCVELRRVYKNIIITKNTKLVERAGGVHFFNVWKFVVSWISFREWFKSNPLYCKPFRMFLDKRVPGNFFFRLSVNA